MPGPLNQSAASASLVTWGRKASTSEDTDVTRDAQVVLARLFQDAAESGAAGRALDSAWSASTSAVLLRCCERRDLATLRAAQKGLREIAGSARRILVQASASGTEQGPSEGRLQAAQERLSTASAFISMADVGAAIARPATIVYQPEWGTIPYRILAALRQDQPTFSKDVRKNVRISESQLSRAFKLLLEHGYVARRHFGKQAVWTLTTAGAQAVADSPLPEKVKKTTHSDVTAPRTPGASSSRSNSDKGRKNDAIHHGGIIKITRYTERTPSILKMKDPLWRIPTQKEAITLGHQALIPDGILNIDIDSRTYKDSKKDSFDPASQRRPRANGGYGSFKKDPRGRSGRGD